MWETVVLDLVPRSQRVFLASQDADAAQVQFLILDLIDVRHSVGVTFSPKLIHPGEINSYPAQVQVLLIPG
jgi:hypothetical protein